MYRIIGADGREYGPISADQLRQWISENRANATTRVLVEGTTEWKNLGSLPEFSTHFSAGTPQGAISPTPAPFPTKTTFSSTTNGLATTGMVLGILSLLAALPCCCCYGMPFNILGLIFSIIGLVQINANPERYTGRGIAIIGIVLSIISIFMAVIWLIIFGVTNNWDQFRHHGYRL